MESLILGFVSFGTAAGAYAALGVFYLWRGKWGSHGPYFLAAVGLTTIWALVSLFGHEIIPRLPKVSILLQQFAMLAWIWFLWHIIASLKHYKTAYPRRLRLGWVLLIAVTLATVLLHAVSLTVGLGWVNLGFTGFNAALLLLAQGLAVALIGLSLTETLYRGYRPAERWGVKFLCLATGGLFAYDIFLYGEGLIFRVLDPGLQEMRGLAQALVVPFLVINIGRSQERHFALGLSQRLVFGSTVVLGAGVYLVVMAAAAYYVQIVGKSWGSAVQTVFLFGALLLLAAILLSGSFRGQIRTFLSHHVLKDKYDYRGEWLRFSERLGAAETDEHFELRVIRALADIVDSPAGALWSLGRNHLPIAAAWNLSPASLTGIDTEGVEAFVKDHDRVWDLTEPDANDAGLPTSWLRLQSAVREIRDSWVLVPLLHQDRLIAFLLLTRPRSPRRLSPEDGELLSVAARQAAGLLAERRLARDVAEARQFERFNQRYAFVAHDLKNLVSQLLLMLRNHERFGDRPEFREDMMETIRSAVARMETVMARLAGRPETLREGQNSGQQESASEGRDAGDEEVSLVTLLQRLVAKHEGRTSELRLLLDADHTTQCSAADGAKLETMVEHLLQNAVEAAGAGGSVAVALRDQDSQIAIEVRDNGPGMDERFVEEELFKPFSSTKRGGFGIGAYQCRALAREAGGDLEAISAPGAGTTMRLTLPRQQQDKKLPQPERQA